MKVNFMNVMLQLLQVEAWKRVRRFGRGCGWWRRGRRFLHRLGGGLTFGAKARANFVGKVVIESTGVGFLVRNTQFHQIIHDYLTLNFQFTRQFVNPNLPHA
jgi:hypothetical protein